MSTDTNVWFSQRALKTLLPLFHALPFIALPSFQRGLGYSPNHMLILEQGP